MPRIPTLTVNESHVPIANLSAKDYKLVDKGLARLKAKELRRYLNVQSLRLLRTKT